MNTNDFSDRDTLLEFQQMLLNPESDNKNVRKAITEEINESSKIMVLSTCITGDKSSRYLVCCLLVNNEKRIKAGYRECYPVQIFDDNRNIS